MTHDNGEASTLTSEDMKRKGGRPKAETPKVLLGFRMAPDVVSGIKATGKGYNGRVEKVLRDALARGELDAERDLALRHQGH